MDLVLRGELVAGCLFVVVPRSFSRGTPRDRGRSPEVNRQSSGPCVTALPHQRVSHKQDRVKRRLPMYILHGLSFFVLILPLFPV